MNLRFFIDRPVFSGVISVVIVLMGLIAIKVLPVEQYPDMHRLLSTCSVPIPVRMPKPCRKR